MEAPTLENVKAALAVDDVPRAVRLAHQAIDAGAANPLLYNLAAYGLQLERRYPESMELLQRALALDPRDALIHNAIGQLLSQQGKVQEAGEAFEKALALQPTLAPAHNGLGQAFEAIGEDERARFHLEQAVRYAPDLAEAFGRLATLAVQRKEFDAAESLSGRALALDPFEPAATIAMASQEIRTGTLDGAEPRLRALLEHGSLAPLHESGALKLLGDIANARGEPGPAFDAYVAGNALLRTVYGSQLDGREDGVELTRRVAKYFRGASKTKWRRSPAPPPSADGPTCHVFMMGFFRSGTTLLEQVLASHPQVVTLEERPTLDPILDQFFRRDGDLDRLAALSDAELLELGADYWKRVRSYGVEPGGKVFVDKLPLSTPWAPLIARLFPDARILFARRDPRDVVLSCFRHRFKITPLMFEFTDIDRAALFYDGVMTLFEIYQEKLGLTVRVCRHETLIEDFDKETREICAFLDIPWHEEMRDFVTTAKSREIRTPSAPQVVRGLYTEGVGQWRAYASHMPEALRILQPWVDKFDYPRS